MSHIVRSARRVLLTFAGVSLICAFAVAQDAATPAAAHGAQKATHLVGLDGIKRNQNGELTINNDGITFVSVATKAQISMASIQGVFTCEDSRQTGGKALMLTKMAVPYGGGRVMSLFTHSKFDSFTVEYRDGNGALHAAIFRLPQGRAENAKKQVHALQQKPDTDTLTTAVQDADKKEKE